MFLIWIVHLFLQLFEVGISKDGNLLHHFACGTHQSSFGLDGGSRLSAERVF
jgi:hypothetical protein